MLLSYLFIALFACLSNAFLLQNRLLSHAGNTALNVRIKVALSDDEPIENAFKRFKKVVNQSGHLVELRFKEHWENAHDKRKRKAERAQVLNKIERANDRYEKRLETGNDYN